MDKNTEFFGACLRGSIPWTTVGLLDYWQYGASVGNKPKDDWPIDPDNGNIEIENPDGTIGMIKVNQFQLEYHLIRYLIQKYGSSKATAHAIRSDKIIEFIRDHSGRLSEIGMFHDQKGVAGPLLDVLVTEPYTIESVDEDTGELNFKFDVDRIIDVLYGHNE